MQSKSTTLTLRSATNHDSEKIHNLIFGDQRTQLPPIPKLEDDLLDIEANYQQRGGLFVVLTDGEATILATLGLYPLNQSDCELRRMTSHPQVQSRDFCRLMLELALASAKQMGFQTVFLEVGSLQKELFDIYRDLGFVPLPAEQISQQRAYQLNLNNYEFRRTCEITAHLVPPQDQAG